MISVEKITSIKRSHRRVLLIALAAIVVFALYQWILAPHTNQLLAAQRYNSSLDAAIHKAEFMRTVIEKKKDQNRRTYEGIRPVAKSVIYAK